MISEEELALVHALQVQPRASWADLAAVLNCTPATAARRWQRLADSGTAWVSVVPGPRAAAFIAFVGLRCGAGRRREVAAALAGDAACVTIETTAGSHDLLIEVITPDLASFSRYLLDRVEQLPHVTGTTVTIATTVVTEASRWRLDALEPGQSSALGATSASPAENSRLATRQLSALDRNLLVELSRDGRLTWHQLGELTGTSAATARRRCERLLGIGEAALRCDLTAPLFERQVTAFLWAQVPAPELDHVARSLTSIPSVRFIATTAGTHNLLVTVWLRSVDDVHRLEVELAARHPALQIHDRTIALHTAKRMGRVFDATGHATTTVPVGPWATA